MSTISKNCDHRRRTPSECQNVCEPGPRPVLRKSSVKHADAVRQALREIGTRFAASTQDAEVLVIGTLSPGPMLDARDKRRVGPRPVIMPWRPDGMPEPAASLLGPPPVLREAI